jgi:hypothetical protein
MSNTCFHFIYICISLISPVQYLRRICGIYGSFLPRFKEMIAIILFAVLHSQFLSTEARSHA